MVNIITYSKSALQDLQNKLLLDIFGQGRGQGHFLGHFRPRALSESIGDRTKLQIQMLLPYLSMT